MTIMNEIVGESGEQGEGCMTAVAIAVGVVVALGLLGWAVRAWMG